MRLFFVLKGRVLLLKTKSSGSYVKKYCVPALIFFKIFRKHLKNKTTYPDNTLSYEMT